jgi:hypothetical protein
MAQRAPADVLTAELVMAIFRVKAHVYRHDQEGARALRPSGKMATFRIWYATG